jgi:hypothetical protein
MDHGSTASGTGRTGPNDDRDPASVASPPGDGYTARVRVSAPVRVGLLYLAVALFCACESRPAFSAPPGPPASVALDVELAHWTLGRYAIDSFEQALRDELAKYNIRVVDRRTAPSLVARIDLGLPGYRQAIDVDLVHDGVRASAGRVRVPDLQETTLDVAAELVAAMIARAVWMPAPAGPAPAQG